MTASGRFVKDRVRLARWWASVILWCVPIGSVVAASATLAVDAGAPRFWVAMAAVLVLSVFGYAASSLPQWAGWVDDSGGAVVILARRLRIVQGLMVALLAGCLAYYGGFYYFNWPEIACFAAAALAAYGGDKFVLPLVTRLTAMFQAAFGKANNGG